MHWKKYSYLRENAYRLGDRHSASIIIEKYNGLSIDGSSAPLQVRFADSPAQKKLKSQTTNAKKTTKNHRLDNILPFPIRPMMPITPETMLGIAPSTSNGYNSLVFFFKKETNQLIVS